MAVASSWQRLVVDDALPNVGVYSLLQDKDGYIWLTSTNGGIRRYDGYQFRHLSLDSLSTVGELPDINILHFDQHDQLWAGSWGYGLTKINLQTEQMQLFSAGTQPQQLRSGFVQTLFEDKDETLWIGTNEGLHSYTVKDGLQRRFQQGTEQLHNRRVWAISQTADGQLWIATSEGLHSFSKDKGLSRVILPHGAASTDNEIRTLLAQQNHLWIGTRAGLFCLNSQTGTLETIRFGPQTSFPIINALASDNQGHIIVGTFDGLFRVDATNLTIEHINDNDARLAGVNVRSILVDKSGLMWVGTRELGVFKGNLPNAIFNAWPKHPQMEAFRHTSQPVTSFLEEQHGLWLGNSNSIHYLSDSPNSQPQHFATTGRVNAFVRHNHTLFVGTDTGLLRFDETQQRFVVENELFRRAGLNALNVRDLASDHRGYFVMGLWGNGVLVQSPDGQLHHLLADIAQLTIGDAVQAMLLRHDRLYIANRLSGLYQYDLQTKKLTHLNQYNTALPTHFQCIASGPNDTLLLCSNDGLIQLNPDVLTFTLFAKDNNLTLQDNLLAAFTDAQQRIWVTSAAGVSVLPSGQQQFITYGKADGLTDQETSFKALQGVADTIYVGTAKGIDRIDTTQIWHNQQAPQVYVTQVLLDHQPLATTWLGNCCQRVVIKPGQTALEFQLAALDYHAPSQNKFSVRLQGYDDDWRPLNGINRAFYANLPPGEYQFLFRGSNHHGVMADGASSVSVQVLPAWWQRPAVQFAAALTLGLLIFVFLRYRMNNLNKINQLLQKSVDNSAVYQKELSRKVEERTAELNTLLADLAESNQQLRQLDTMKDDFISTVSHELRTPLTSIHGALRLLSSPQLADNPVLKQQMLSTAEENSQRLLTLVNDLLDLQKFESGSMQLQFKVQPVKPLIEQAIASLQGYANQFKAELQPFQTYCPTELLLDSLRFRQVLDNLLSNAIKFSKPQGKVWINVETHQQHLLLEVHDEGEGIPFAVQKRLFSKFFQADSSDQKHRYGSGLGLVICKKIIELHAGEIGFHSTPGQGSVFWLKLSTDTTSPPVGAVNTHSS